MHSCITLEIQALLSGGVDDTPVDLVKWQSSLRLFRVPIDFGTLILRIYLWVFYNASYSVFLVKNLYGLLHTIAMIERSQGVKKYPKYTLFTDYVSPQDWYGMNQVAL